ncbi:MAG: HD-GYP domain-containing protein [Gammaproteobacteria bacterium]|nr:HD-GYP domain-containing protein [Gammaproteobacteria bacterium]
MRKRVAVQHLQLGMFVVELDRPWVELPFEMPFQLQGFRLRLMEELEKVQKYCKFVYIDPRLGKDADRYLPEPENAPLLSADALPGISPANQLDPVYQDTTSFEEELPVAQEVLDDSRRVYAKVMDAAQAGRGIDGAALREVVRSMVNTVVRNPDAINWLGLLKHRDNYSYDHSIAACVLALTFGRHLGLPRKQLRILGTAVLLQDIGKLRIPEDLLTKPTPLTAAERLVIQRHVGYSIEIIKGGNISNEAKEVIFCHHERFDGTGYPRGLLGDDIGFLSLISGIVDSYDAMTSVRPYRPAFTSFEALSYLYDLRYMLFPGALVEHFIHCVGIFPIGTFVQLNTGHVGIVVARNRIRQLKPRVMIVVDAEGGRLEQPDTLDLAEQEGDESRPWRIAQVVDPDDFGLDRRQFFTA